MKTNCFAVVLTLVCLCLPVTARATVASWLPDASASLVDAAVQAVSTWLAPVAKRESDDQCPPLKARYQSLSRKSKQITKEMRAKGCPTASLDSPDAAPTPEAAAACDALDKLRDGVFAELKLLADRFAQRGCNGAIEDSPGPGEGLSVLPQCLSRCSPQDYKTGQCVTCRAFTGRGPGAPAYTIDCASELDARLTLTDACAYLASQPGGSPIACDTLTCGPAGELFSKYPTPTEVEARQGFRLYRAETYSDTVTVGLTIFFPFAPATVGTASVQTTVTVAYTDTVSLTARGTSGLCDRDGCETFKSDAQLTCVVSRKVTRAQTASGTVDIAGSGGTNETSTVTDVEIFREWTLSVGGMSFDMARDLCLRSAESARPALTDELKDRLAKLQLTGKELKHQCYDDNQCSTGQECRSTAEGNRCYSPLYEGGECTRLTYVNTDMPVLAADGDQERCARGLTCTRIDSRWNYFERPRFECRNLSGYSNLKRQLDAGGTPYVLKSRWKPNGQELCLDEHQGADEKARGFVFAHPCNGGDNQKFKYFNGIQMANGTTAWLIAVVSTGRCLDVHTSELDGPRDDIFSDRGGKRIYLNQECHGRPNQRFVHYDDGTIRDTWAGPGWCLDIWSDDSEKYGNGYKVYVARCHGASNQQWDAIATQ